MTLTRRALLTLAVAGSVAAMPAAAQTFPIPGKPIRIVVPFPAGGQTDIQARFLAQRMQTALGNSVVVDNKSGASTIIGTQDVIRSAPDGHTILYTIAVTGAQNPHLFSKLPYDPLKDLTPVMFAARSGTVLVVPASSPFKTVRELIDHARANPGKLNFGSFSLGSTSHLNGELLKINAGIDIVHVPFRGSADAIVALLGGQVQMLFDGPTTALTNAAAGKVRMLGVANTPNFGPLKSVPTMAEAGVPGLDISGGMQFFGPAGMSRDVLQRVNAALAAALKTPEAEKLYLEGGTEIVASSPEEHTRLFRDQYERWGAIIRKLNIKLD
ncbi:MAG: tripartite tricarboxylate transporter substrate binding protein [Burkholderiales bacterium]|nr:tripartite tricarboxylate transporter substrate binding protein [Burkholderiales bacterium]